MKSAYKIKFTELADTKFAALATPDAFMGSPVEIWYDEQCDVFWQRRLPIPSKFVYPSGVNAQQQAEIYHRFRSCHYHTVYITTINPVTDAYRDQRVAAIEKMYREYWASCT